MSENKKDLYPNLGLSDIIKMLQTKEILNFFKFRKIVLKFSISCYFTEIKLDFK